MSLSDLALAFNGSIGNCSLYSLASGNLSYLVNGSNTFETYNILAFPAYFITNCTDEGVEYWIQNVLNNATTSDQFWTESYYLENSGDAFVSFLFTISGTCVASWMLCFLLLLSPKHKRRPIMTQIATVFNAIVLSILLSKVTDTAREDYYSDHVDIFKVHDVYFNNLTFRVTNVFSEALISFSFFQIVSRISSKSYQDYIVVTYATVLVAYVALGIVCEVKFRRPLNSLILDSNFKSLYTRVHRAKNVFKLLIVALVGVLILYYTLIIKNPRKYSYSRRLIPLAIFVWFLFACHFAVCCGIIAIVDHDWTTRSWLSVLPSLLEIGILTVLWEWIYNIKTLERRSELAGVLGRRISFDDDKNFQTTKDKGDNKRKGRKHRTRIVNWVKDKVILHNPTVDFVDESDNNLKLVSTNDSTNISTQDSTTTPEQQVLDTSDNNNNNENNNNRGNQNNENVDRSQSGSANDTSEEYDVQYVDDYELYDIPTQAPQYNPQEGSSSQQYQTPQLSGSENPPDFEVHPGFNRGDYWPDEKRR